MGILLPLNGRLQKTREVSFLIQVYTKLNQDFSRPWILGLSQKFPSVSWCSKGSFIFASDAFDFMAIKKINCTTLRGENRTEARDIFSSFIITFKFSITRIPHNPTFRVWWWMTFRTNFLTMAQGHHFLLTLSFFTGLKHAYKCFSTFGPGC